MEDLVTWLRACLDDDERVAREVSEKAPYDEWDAAGAQGEDDAALSNWEVIRIARPYNRPDARSVAEHIARWDPARVLADIEAKRRILDAFETWQREDLEAREDYQAWALGEPHRDGPYRRTVSEAAGEGLKLAIRALAQPFAGRPGWREEWAA